MNQYNLVMVIYRLLKTLSVMIQLQWVPAHSGIRGNEMAHQLVRSAMDIEEDFIRLPNSYDDVREKISRRAGEECRVEFRQSNSGSKRVLQGLSVSKKMNHMVGSRELSVTAH